MTQSQSSRSAEAARAALDSVSRAERAGLLAAYAPRWLIWLTAILVGAMFAAQQGWLTVILLALNP